jgi:hypothetical protein
LRNVIHYHTPDDKIVAIIGWQSYSIVRRPTWAGPLIEAPELPPL